MRTRSRMPSTSNGGAARADKAYVASTTVWIAEDTPRSMELARGIEIQPRQPWHHFVPSRAWTTRESALQQSKRGGEPVDQRHGACQRPTAERWRVIVATRVALKQPSSVNRKRLHDPSRSAAAHWRSRDRQRQQTRTMQECTRQAYCRAPGAYTTHER